MHVHPRARVLLPFFLVVLIAFSVYRFGCTSPEPEHLELSGATMGTTWSAKISGASSESADSLTRIIQSRLDVVDSLLSTYKPESELMQFNRGRSIGWIPVTRAFLEVMEISVEVGRLSEGALDVTLAPVIRAWGFGAGGEREKVPSVDSLKTLAAWVGPDRILVDKSKGVIRKTHPRVTLDLSAVAKGYGVDAAASALVRAGHRNFLIEVGGELTAQGTRSDGASWRIAIERPEPDRRLPHETLELSGLAMATSGDYRNYYETDGKRLSHIIDPRTLAPIDHRLAAVTVLHQTCAVADAWATALLVLGEEAGWALAQEMGLAAFFIVRDSQGVFQTKRTSAFPEE